MLTITWFDGKYLLIASFTLESVLQQRLLPNKTETIRLDLKMTYLCQFSHYFYVMHWNTKLVLSSQDCFNGWEIWQLGDMKFYHKYLPNLIVFLVGFFIWNVLRNCHPWQEETPIFIKVSSKCQLSLKTLITAIGTDIHNPDQPYIQLRGTYPENVMKNIHGFGLWNTHMLYVCHHDWAGCNYNPNLGE